MKNTRQISLEYSATDLDKNKITILVATHKKTWMPNDAIYLPIHCGKALNNSNFSYQGDDTGNNISEKNPKFCELTALYWGWKNLSSDYIGLCHYRRYFGDREQIRLYDKNDYQRILSEYDIIIPKKLMLQQTSFEQYVSCDTTFAKDLLLAINMTKKLYPEYYPFLLYSLKRKYMYPNNMFVTNKYIFDQYCQFLFNLAFVLEDQIDCTNYTVTQTRVIGYIAERLFNAFLLSHQFKCFEANILFIEQAYTT